MGVQHDVEVEIQSMEPVSQLKLKYAESAGVETQALRLFFNGKELQDAESLASYYIRNQMVVQVFVKA